MSVSNSPEAEVPRKRRKYAERMPLDKRREQLLDAALGVVLTDGIRDVTMERIALAAGVTKPVVYSVFENAETVLQALMEREQARALAQLQAALPPDVDRDPATVASVGITGFLRVVRENAETWRFLLSAEQLPDGPRRQHDRVREYLVRQITDLAERALAQRRGGALDPELIARLLVVSVESCARLVLAEPDRFTEERLGSFVAELVRSVLEG